MLIKQIKLSHVAKEQLSRLKRKTGIKNWNVLCRWALCYSLSEKTIPTDVKIKYEDGIEISWFTFCGEYYELYEALIKNWCIEMNLSTDNETMIKYFYLNLERGIAYLSGTGFIRSIDDLVNLSIRGQ